MPYELNTADERILRELVDERESGDPWGRQLPKNISRDLEYSRQYIQNRLQMLEAAGFVDNIGGGCTKSLTMGSNESPIDVLYTIRVTGGLLL